MKAFKLQNAIVLSFSNGEVLTDIPYTEESWEYIQNHLEEEEKIYKHFCPTEAFLDSDIIAGSNLLVYENGAVTMPLVSNISIPKDIICEILKAEEFGNQTEINKWINFWTFVSMNPNEAVRDNIFWFLKKWGIQITNSGLIRAYRNVDIYQEANKKYTTKFIKETINTYYKEKYINGEDPSTILDKEGKSLEFYYNDIMNEGNDTPIYTDHHSRTFRIKLGKPVRMPREEADQDSTISCSRGLHCASAGWLERNYYGSVGLEVLVNPAQVVAIPVIDDYGKLRCCEYFPIAIVDFDTEGHVIVPELDLSNDIEYLKTLKYEGEINNKEGIHYLVGKSSREDIYSSVLKRLK